MGKLSHFRIGGLVLATSIRLLGSGTPHADVSSRPHDWFLNREISFGVSTRLLEQVCQTDSRPGSSASKPLLFLNHGPKENMDLLGNREDPRRHGKRMA